MANQYRTAQDADSPFRRWRFEEDAGAITFVDDIASTGAAVSTPMTAAYPNPNPGRPAAGRGADFSGGHCTLSSISGWTSLQTIEALVWMDSIATTRPSIFEHAWTAGQKIPLVLGWNVDGSHSGLLGFGYYDGSTWRVVHMSTALSTGTMHHVMGVYNGTTGLTLYVDGSSVASGTVTARSSGTINSTGYIGARYDGNDPIDGRIFDLALYTTGLSSSRVTAHYTASLVWSGLLVSGGGHPSISSGLVHVCGYPETLSGGGHLALTSPSGLLVPGDGTTWTTYGELSVQPTMGDGSQRQLWKYVASASGSLTVDNTGTGWNTVLTVYAADLSTVLGTSSTPGGAASVTVSVTAASTYYVAVSRGSGATASDGRYLLNAVGPRSSDAPPNESPAAAPPDIPAASSPPAGMSVVALKRVSAIFPAPTLVAGRPHLWMQSSVVEADWGIHRVIVEGTDVTYFRGFPVRVESYDLQEPFGCGPATITFPGITPHDSVGTGDTSWLRGGYTVEIVGPSGSLWLGYVGNQIGTYDSSTSGYTVECVGEIWQADTVSHQPRTYLPPTDIGSVVTAALNQVTHRRIGDITAPATGILTSQRGASDQSVISYVQELLATAATTGGGQWTIARTGRATYAMQLKDRSTVTWSVRTGQPGVEIRMNLDSTTAVNRIYGRGINPSGYAWAGWVYPSTGIAAAPSYPNSNPSTVLTIGSTDAGTTSGTGVSDWQRRINETGIAKVTVDGTYSAADAAAAKLAQSRMGLTVDGVVGPQTWAASFDVGNNGADLNSAYRAPLAAQANVVPLLTRADGSFGGTNPSDNPQQPVVDRDEDFGEGITKAQAIISAQNEIARSATPGWVGEVVLRADPAEMSKWDIKEGSNGVIYGWTGRDVTVHVADVKANPPQSGTDAGSVTLTVDEHARDLVTLGAILRRDKDASRNPAMLPPRKQRRSGSRPDTVVEYDGESSGGIIPRHALYSRLWTVIRIPVSQAGKVAQVIAQTVPATAFVLAFFGDAVTPADLTSLVGADPLTDRGDGYGPFDWNADALVTRGFIEALGGPGQACGFSPGYQTSPRTGRATALTGKLVSTGAWTYQSVRPPWLWLAEWATASTYISGRIYPAPLDT